MKVLKDNSKSVVDEEKNMMIYPMKINCSECDSELEITEEDTHIGWLGARFITCPCCGYESMINELDGITLTKDNLEFPVHFSRNIQGLRHVVEVNSEEIIKEIKRGIEYFRIHKDECYWFKCYGDLFLIIFRYSDGEEYFIVVTKDYYETNIPFERDDYE